MPPKSKEMAAARKRGAQAAAQAAAQSQKQQQQDAAANGNAAPSPVPEPEQAAPDSPSGSQSFRRRTKRPNIPAPAALNALREVLVDFKKLRRDKEAKVLTTPLRFEEAAGEAAADVTYQVKSLLPNKNKLFFAYEDSLLKIMERLDAIDTQGVGPVREARKNAIASVQGRLHVLDAYKRGEKVEVEEVEEEVWEETARGNVPIRSVGKRGANDLKLSRQSSGPSWTRAAYVSLLAGAAGYAFYYLQRNPSFFEDLKSSWTGSNTTA
ncbi:hypothetical protein DFS34DRAFT_648147 [Phlyctochytrium arcticum]|nr:hypothetical protein DFS34DRAFT_648147 [Phlyctochytrium arcticum]